MRDRCGRRCLAAATLTVLLGAAAPVASAEEVFVFERLNRRYDDLEPEVQPFRQGPLSVAIDVQTASVEVMRHRFALSPRADGTHRLRVQLRFRGAARVNGHVRAGGLGSDLSDRIRFPTQERTWEGTVRIRREPEAYAVTLVEGPRVIRVEAESELGAQTVALCNAAALWPGSGLACDAVEAFFRNPPLRLPAAGETSWIERAELTEAERSRLDLYLAAAR